MTRGAAPLVAHLIYRLDFGGLENGLVNLVNRMPADRYRHAIICLAGFNPEFRRRIHRHDVAVVSVDKLPGKDPGAFVRVWRHLRRLRPAIVHTRNFGTLDLQWVAALAGVRRRVHGEHGLEGVDLQGGTPRRRAIRRACRPLVKRWVPMSQDLARWLQREVGVQERRIRQIYNGVDTERFRPTPDLSSPSPAPAGEGRGAGSVVTIGTLGRLDPVKNQAALLHAFAAILDRNPALRDILRLKIAGTGPLEGGLKALAATLGVGPTAQFPGVTADAAAFLRTLDIFVLPSHREGISNTILEAMATALPVVATRVGGNPELVVEGVTGCLYDPTAPAALEQALLPYLTDLARRAAHGNAGRERVVQNFSLDAMVQRYMDLYDELLTPSPALVAEGRGEGS